MQAASLDFLAAPAAGDKAAVGFPDSEEGGGGEGVAAVSTTSMAAAAAATQSSPSTSWPWRTAATLGGQWVARTRRSWLAPNGLLALTLELPDDGDDDDEEEEEEEDEDDDPNKKKRRRGGTARPLLPPSGGCCPGSPCALPTTPTPSSPPTERAASRWRR